jgi:hypothetical protein
MLSAAIAADVLSLSPRIARCGQSAPSCKRLRSTSRLHLALQFVQKAPIGGFGDDLLRARFDQPDLMQPQRVKSKAILSVIFAPFVVAVFAESLQRVFVLISEAITDNAPGCAFPIGGAQIGGFQDGA